MCWKIFQHCTALCFQRKPWCSTQNRQVSLLTVEQSTSFHFTELLIWEMLHYIHYFHGPLLDSLQYVQVSPLLGNAELDMMLQVWLHQSWTTEEKDHFPQPAGNTFPKASYITVSLLVARVHCSFVFNLVSTGTPKPFPVEMLSSL